MEFRILGPLGVSTGERTLVLGGFKQRAVLGLLLLRANRVVATSELLAALWPDEERPATARKIVQNAVWGLRALLAEEPPAPGEQAPELITQAPGYVLRVRPENVDLKRFDRRVAEGRARLAGDEPAEAARLLGQALEEWHGSALADLAEEGVEWPELTALRQLRLDVMEDRFEAELRSGRHHAVLGDLVSLADEEPLRERLCGQLMLALYRCGRQAEALGAFSRVRHALVEEYGLEPSRELQVLQQGILAHDPALAPARDAERVPPQHAAREHVTPDLAFTGEPIRQPVVVTEARTLRDAHPAPVRAPFAAADAVTAGAQVSARREVAVLLVRTGFAGQAEALGGAQVALPLHDALTAVSDCVEAHGGVVAGSVGYLCVAVFGLRTDLATAATSAVRTALDVRDRLAALSGPTCHAVVSAGEALVRTSPDNPTHPPSVAGRMVDEARALLAQVPPGGIHLCGDAIEATVGGVRHLPAEAGGSGGRTGRLFGLYPEAEPGTPLSAPVAAHHTELTILRGLLDRSRRHDAPHLMTLLGDPDVGKSRLLADFERDVAGEPVRVVRLGFGGGAVRMAYDVLTAVCGRASGPAAGDWFTDTVHRLAGHGTTAQRLIGRLRPLVENTGAMRELGDAVDSWCDLVVLLAREQPLVLCLDDAHRADDAVLDCVERLASTRQEVPLFVVACARPELLERRPLWGRGPRHAGILTLDRLAEPALVPGSRIDSGPGTGRS